MTNLDTPDNQVGTFNPQVLLKTVPGGTAATTVTPTPNMETLVVVGKMTAVLATPNVTGVSTGTRYPYVRTNVGSLPAEWVTLYAEVSTVLDPEVHIEWGTAPTTEWYVYADAGIHLTIDPALAGTIGEVGGPRPNGLVLVGGSGPFGAEPIEIDSLGQQYVIPTIPHKASGDHPFTELEHISALEEGTATILAAPGSGKRYRLFSVSLSSTGAGQVGYVQDALSGQAFAGIVGVGNSVTTIPGQGVPLSENAALRLTLEGAAGKVVLVAYYTTETI